MGPIGDSIFLALIVDAAHLLPLFAEMGLMGPIGDSIFVALIVDGGVLLPLFCGDEKRLPWGSLGGYFLDFLDFLAGLAIPSRARSASTVGSLPRNAL